MIPLHLERMHNPRFRHLTEPQDSPVWKQLHNRINSDLYSASVIPNLMGIGYKARCYEYDIIKGLKEDKDISHLEHIKFGKESEPLAKEDFQKAFPFLMCITPGIIYHEKYPNIAASSDMICISKKDGALLNVEIKCKYNGILPETPEGIAPKVLVQANVQMAVTGIGFTVLWFWTKEKQIGWLMPYHEGMWQECLAAVEEFRTMLAENKRPHRTKVKQSVLNCISEINKSLKQIY